MNEVDRNEDRKIHRANVSQGASGYNKIKTSTTGAALRNTDIIPRKTGAGGDVSADLAPGPYSQIVNATRHATPAL
ncbi:hypothetical protein EVAR_48039_1 [Eumeta japonica]|uniref:Uncharacterized protein n=1 Tax=Eumeta variegata TaxID=151549 RepID=A0A4C1XJM8_EUMVA|nr:hypothetical protein EVAR_48039_1 [Eumeta japonica]